MKCKIVYIVSNVNKSLAFEWIAEKLDKSKFELSFLLMNPENSELEIFLNKTGVPVKRLVYRNKKDIPTTLLKIRSYLKENRTDVVHTHLFDANIAGIIASKLAGIKKIIYTRHHSTLHHQYHQSAVKWDKLCNRFSTHIISISDVVTDVLTEMENVPAEKIIKIHHGFDLTAFEDPKQENIHMLRDKYLATKKNPVIGVISRFTEWKGVQFIIPAFEKLLSKSPNAKILFFNAEGDYERNIHQMLKKLPEDSYSCIKFENDIASLYQLFDIFVHVPIDHQSEAFGQTYIETMAAGIPIIATRSGIGNEILKDKLNSIVVPYNDSEAIYKAMLELLDPSLLRKQLIDGGKETVASMFSIDTMISSLEKVYLH
jgi:glycosyltransferase involved in cell wall biosynthesis